MQMEIFAGQEWSHLKKGLSIMSSKRAYLAGACFGAIMAASSAAYATPTFTLSGASLPGYGGVGNIVASDMSGLSNATVHDMGGGVQHEVGYAIINGLTNNGVSAAGQAIAGKLDLLDGALGAGFYKLYITFETIVTGVGGGFGGGTLGTIAPGDFTFKLWADLGNDTAFAPAALNGSNPLVGGTLSDDIVLAVGVGGGTAGFLSPSGAPFFSAVSDFIICNGTANSGKKANTTVTGGSATGCGTFNALNYFTDPVPFFDFSLEASTPASNQNVKTTSDPSAVQLDGIRISINFARPVPEPVSIALFGAGLAGIAGFGARRKKKFA